MSSIDKVLGAFAAFDSVDDVLIAFLLKVGLGFMYLGA